MEIVSPLMPRHTARPRSSPLTHQYATEMSERKEGDGGQPKTLLNSMSVAGYAKEGVGVMWTCFRLNIKQQYDKQQQQ